MTTTCLILPATNLFWPCRKHVQRVSRSFPVSLSSFIGYTLTFKQRKLHSGLLELCKSRAPSIIQTRFHRCFEHLSITPFFLSLPIILLKPCTPLRLLFEQSLLFFFISQELLFKSGQVIGSLRQWKASLCLQLAAKAAVYWPDQVLSDWRYWIGSSRIGSGWCTTDVTI